jgi:hypothetical protein
MCALSGLGLLHQYLLLVLSNCLLLLLLLCCSAAPHAGAHAALDSQAADHARQHRQHQALPVTTHGEQLAGIIQAV